MKPDIVARKTNKPAVLRQTGKDTFTTDVVDGDGKATTASVSGGLIIDTTNQPRLIGTGDLADAVVTLLSRLTGK